MTREKYSVYTASVKKSRFNSDKFDLEKSELKLFLETLRKDNENLIHETNKLLSVRGII